MALELTLIMVYIRAKKVKGIDYAYLVRSQWDVKNKTSRQITIKYLGKASDIEIEDIPEIYRNDPKVVTFLSEHNPRDIGKKWVMIDGFCAKLFDYLSSGNVKSALELYKGAKDVLSLEDFYDKVLRPVMYDIGDKWEKGELDIATEHVCSNTAQALIASVRQMDNTRCNGKQIFLFCPDGELHHMSTLVLESVLRSRGYHVINASPSIPTGSIMHYIDNNEPDLIMVSVTLPENIGAARRIVREISEEFRNTPILVGGSAFVNFKADFLDAIVVSPDDNSLEDILRLVRSTLQVH